MLMVPVFWVFLHSRQQ